MANGVGRSGMSLVEVVLAAALLVLMLVVTGVLLTHTVRATGFAHGLQLARQAAAETVERMRAAPIRAVGVAFWTDPAVRTMTIDGVTWVVADRHVPSGLDTLARVRIAVLDEPVARGSIRPPSDDEAMLALRLLSEAEYGALVGVAIDLDGDGSAMTPLPAAASGAAFDLAYYPFLVRAAWVGELGPERHTLLSVVGAELEADGGE